MNLQDKMLQADNYLHDAMVNLNALKTLCPERELVEQVICNVESARSYLQNMNDATEDFSLADIFDTIEEDGENDTESEDDRYYGNDGYYDSYDDDDYYDEEEKDDRYDSSFADINRRSQERNGSVPKDLASFYSSLTAADVAQMAPPERAAYDAWLQAVSFANAIVPPNPYQAPTPESQQAAQQAAQALHLQQQQKAAAEEAARQQAMYEAQVRAMQEQQQRAQEEAMRQAAAEEAMRQAAAEEAARKRVEEEARKRAEIAAQQQAEAKRLAEEKARAARQAEIAKKQIDYAKSQGANAFIMPSLDEISAKQAMDAVTKASESYELDSDWDAFDVEYIPFNINEFDISRNGGPSSMYMECMRHSVGEWNVPELLTEDVFDMKEFSIYGNLPDGTDVVINWSGDTSVVSSSVAAIHGIGALVEARSSRGASIANITTITQGSGIIDSAPAMDAREALSYLPMMDVNYISMDIEYDDLFYTLWFADGSRDIEISWIQEEGITSSDLAHLIQEISMSIGVYAEAVSGTKREYRLDKRTSAGRFHDHPEQYLEAQNRALMEGHMVMNLKAISIDESGKTKIRTYKAQ